MKITYENELTGQKVILEDVRNDADIDEMQEVLERLLLGIGYHPDCITAMFSSYNQESI